MTLKDAAFSLLTKQNCSPCIICRQHELEAMPSDSDAELKEQHQTILARQSCQTAAGELPIPVAQEQSSGIYGSSLTSDSAKSVTKQPKKSMELGKWKCCPSCGSIQIALITAVIRSVDNLDNTSASWQQAGQDPSASVPHQLRISTSQTSNINTMIVKLYMEIKLES